MSLRTHPYGCSKNILSFTEDGSITFNCEVLNSIFLHPEVKNRRIVILSIIGAYRKGKSFLLNYCLRYLYAHYCSINFPNNPVLNLSEWIGNEDEPLLGFPWSSGSDPNTSGIVIWTDVFLHTNSITREKIAIIVMDTQGLFDCATSCINTSRIFALSSLISSIQILNLSGYIQEEHLSYLNFATEFAKYAAHNTEGTKENYFQKLIFLIRDWCNVDDHLYGFSGGKEYLKLTLSKRSSTKKELNYIRENINSTFEELSCALLPHPGKYMIGVKKNYNTIHDGRHGLMDDEFREEFTNAIVHILSPKKLAVKKINGYNVKGFQFFEYILMYFEIFKTENLPQVQTVYESTVEKYMTFLVDFCFDTCIDAISRNLDEINRQNKFNFLKEMSKGIALLKYSESKKMGNIGHHAQFKRTLETKIDKYWIDFEKECFKNNRNFDFVSENEKEMREVMTFIEFRREHDRNTIKDSVEKRDKFHLKRRIEFERIHEIIQNQNARFEINPGRRGNCHERNKRSTEHWSENARVENDPEQRKSDYAKPRDEHRNRNSSCSIL